MPDLQDNVAVGKSNNKALGSTAGANTVTSTGNVGGSTANATLSTAQLASHNHTAPIRAPGGDLNNSVSRGFHTLSGGNLTMNNTGSGSGHQQVS